MSNNNNFINRDRFIQLDYKPYQYLDGEELQSLMEKIIVQWEAFLDKNDPGLQLNRDYFIHGKNLSEVIVRCDKRALYHYTFHTFEEDEYKKWAILCFWINTLKPFMIVNEKAQIYNCANEMFSFHLIIEIIRGAFKKEFPDKEFVYPSEKRIHDIVYDFKYCSLSREAMIAFVETYADTYGVGINHILNKE